MNGERDPDPGEAVASRRLWLNVLHLAFHDALVERPKMSSAVMRERAEARTWLIGFGRDFINVCDSAGMDANYIRERAKRIAAGGWKLTGAAGEAAA